MMFKYVESPAKPKKVKQSKDVVAQIRFEPQHIKELRNLCFVKSITFPKFVRQAVALYKIYFDHRNILFTRSDEIIPLLRIIRRKR